MSDVTAVGELLIDFTPAGLSSQGYPIFEQNPGGAPGNVVVCLSKLGRSTACIGKLGDDHFGHAIKASLQREGVDTRGLVMTGSCHTTLAFVHLDEHGDRSFSFYRNPGADLLLESGDLSFNLIDDCQIFHFGSVSMTGNPSRQATLAAVRYAREEGKLISYDPNLRLMLWPSPEIARTTILQAMPLVDVLKISEEELLFLTGETDLNRGAGQLLSDYDLQLVLITLGRKGAYARNCLGEAWHPAFDVATIDTTGSGDAFTGSFLYQLLQAGKPPQSLTEDDLTAFLAFANAAGSLASTRKGAIPAMPTLAEIEDCLAHSQPLE